MAMLSALPPRAIIPAVENLTHSLLGAALAELTLPAGATPAQRRSFFAAGIVAANLPDADLVYTGITPEPLGYLLHHRGHTHTVVGLVAQAMLVGAVFLLPALRRRVGSLRGRLAVLVGVALLSHLVLDSWNSYGVHPFWPLDSRWYYLDSIFILEPWLWLLLGVAVTLNTRNSRGRVALGALLVALAVALVAMDMAPAAALIALAAGAVAFGVLLRRWTPRARAGAALAATASFVVLMLGAHAHVEAKAMAAIPAAVRAPVVDIVLSPQPGNPLCWRALAITANEGADRFHTTRGTVSVAGSAGCPDQRTAVEWEPPVSQSLARLRDRVNRDCWVRAWMQFGRAPELTERSISDLRYGDTGRENFSAMPLRSAREPSACPRNLTRWGLPRADLLRPVRAP
jgi:inner membrane protein